MTNSASRKGGKVASKTPPKVAPSCRVDVNSLASKCRKTLMKALELEHVSSTKQERQRQVSLYFGTSHSVIAEIRGEMRPVLPLPENNRWLHAAIDLTSAGAKGWQVTHVSVSVLEGDPSSPQKTPVLRAEWHQPENPDDNGHAQPHWHVMRAAEALPSFDATVEADQFEAFVEVANTPAAVPEDIFNHFHYAMVTDWHRSPSAGPRAVLESEAALVAWLDGCTRYIRHQLAHVDGKTAAPSKSPF